MWAVLILLPAPLQQQTKTDAESRPKGIWVLKFKLIAKTAAAATPEQLAAAEALASDPAKVEGLKRAISMGFMLIPAIALIIGLVFLLFGYTLNKEKIAQYQAEIDQQKSAQ